MATPDEGGRKLLPPVLVEPKLYGVQDKPADRAKAHHYLSQPQ